MKAVVGSEQEEPNNGIVMEWFCGHDGHMIRIRHQQPSLWEGLFAEEVAELWEPWMGVVDASYAARFSSFKLTNLNRP